MAGRDEKLRNYWDSLKIIYKKQLDNPVNYTLILYNLQLGANLLFDYAYRKGAVDILDQLAELFLIPLKHLRQLDFYWYYRGGSTRPPYTRKKLAPILGGSVNTPMWVNDHLIEWKENGTKMEKTIQLEVILHSSQFLYLMSHALHVFVSLEDLDASKFPNIKKFIDDYPLVLKEHYDRWIFAPNDTGDEARELGIFQTIGWGCITDRRFNHRQFIDMKLKWRRDKKADPARFAKKPTFCDGVRDEDMWVLCGAVELLAARQKKNNLFSLDAGLEKQYLDYFGVGCQLIKSRLKPTRLKDFSNTRVSGYNFDPGAWASHRDYKYAGHDSTGYPEGEPSQPPPGDISWDISHARRFVQVFETLYRNKNITKQSFPELKVLQGFANQVAYKVFQGNFDRPHFKNFFNGTDGWYRIGFHGEGFGIAPDDQSVEWLSGGMASWRHYQPDIKRISDALWSMIESNDAAVEAFKKNIYGHPFYKNKAPFPVDYLNPHKFAHLLNFIAATEMPSIDSGAVFPELSVDRGQLVFGAKEGSGEALSQIIRVSSKGEGQLSWNVASDTPWLTCTPQSGTGEGIVTVSVNPQHLRFGKYHGRVTVSQPGSEKEPQTVAVSLRVFRRWRRLKPIGALDGPADNSIASGSVPVTGWALDKIGIESVKLYRLPLQGEGRKPIYIGDAAFTEDTRKDVENVHLDYPLSHRGGWGYMFLTNALPGGGNGPVTLLAKAKSLTGREETVGKTTIRCNNADAVKPFGAIDAPVPGKTVSGTVRITGWVLTPPPNKIPEDGSTINVFIDGKHVGHANYNIPRADIHRLFPQCLNSKKSHVFFELDTTTFSNGLHQLQWSVSDNAGHGAGIGSRFIRVQN
jgi:hypothetical protein